MPRSDISLVTGDPVRTVASSGTARKPGLSTLGVNLVAAVGSDSDLAYSLAKALAARDEDDKRRAGAAKSYFNTIRSSIAVRTVPSALR